MTHHTDTRRRFRKGDLLHVSRPAFKQVVRHRGCDWTERVPAWEAELEVLRGGTDRIVVYGPAGRSPVPQRFTVSVRQVESHGGRVRLLGGIPKGRRVRVRTTNGGDTTGVLAQRYVPSYGVELESFCFGPIAPERIASVEEL